MCRWSNSDIPNPVSNLRPCFDLSAADVHCYFFPFSNPFCWLMIISCRLPHRRNTSSMERSSTPKKPRPWRVRSLWRRSSSAVSLLTLPRRKSESTSVPSERYDSVRPACRYLLTDSSYTSFDWFKHSLMMWSGGVYWTSHGEQNKQEERILLHHIQRGGSCEEHHGEEVPQYWTQQGTDGFSTCESWSLWIWINLIAVCLVWNKSGDVQGAVPAAAVLGRQRWILIQVSRKRWRWVETTLNVNNVTYSPSQSLMTS